MRKIGLITEDPGMSRIIQQAFSPVAFAIQAYSPADFLAGPHTDLKNIHFLLLDYCVTQPAQAAIWKAWEHQGKIHPLIVFNGPDRADTAVDLIKKGASDYLPDIQVERLVFAVEQAAMPAKSSEGEFGDTSELLHTLLDAMPDIVCFKDGQGRWLYANQADRDLFQLNGIDYRGKTDAELGELSPFYRLPLLSCIETDEAAWAKGAISRKEEAIPRPDGSTSVFDVYKVPLFHADGSRKGLVVLGRDINEKKQAQLALEETDLLFTQVFHHSPVGLLTFNEEKILTCNERLAAIIKTTRDQLMQMSFKELQDRNIMPAIQMALKGKEGFFEGRYRATISKAEVWLSLRTAPLYSSDGEIRAGIGIVEDISEHKRTEAQIQSQLQRLAALHNIDVAITSCLDLRMTLSLLLDQAINQLQIDAGEIRLYNKFTQTLDCNVQKGFRTGSLPVRSLHLGQGLAGRAALEQKIFHYPDTLDALQRTSIETLMIRREFATCYAVPLIAKGQIKGVMEVYSYRQLTPNQEWLDFLNALGVQAAIAVDNNELFDNLQRTNVDLTMAIDSMLAGLAQALDLREGVPVGHSRTLTDLAMRLARVSGMAESELVPLRRGALLHDIGKVVIPENILWKTGPLSEGEQAILDQHADYAYQILSPISFFHQALEIPYCHHECWDGSGYPRGLKGEQIPLAARVFAVADEWYELIYMQNNTFEVSRDAAARQLQAQAGRKLDPRIVGAFFKHIYTEN